MTENPEKCPFCLRKNGFYLFMNTITKPVCQCNNNQGKNLLFQNQNMVKCSGKLGVVPCPDDMIILIKFNDLDSFFAVIWLMSGPVTDDNMAVFEFLNAGKKTKPQFFRMFVGFPPASDNFAFPVQFEDRGPKTAGNKPVPVASLNRVIDIFRFPAGRFLFRRV